MLTRADALNIPAPALNSRWIVLFENQIGPYKGIVETVEATFIRTEARARYSQGSNNYFPEATDIDGLNIMFYEDEEFSVTKWLKDWRRKVHDPADGTYGVANDYKKRVYVELFSLVSNKPVLQLCYRNCWPTTNAGLPLTYEDGTGRLQVNQQFSVDTLEFQE
tara:strand:+ start:516 stop:1007 length:492 start_codon:yes stop_codon:yes gene_type:complete